MSEATGAPTGADAPGTSTTPTTSADTTTTDGPSTAGPSTGDETGPAPLECGAFTPGDDFHVCTATYLGGPGADAPLARRVPGPVTRPI